MALVTVDRAQPGMVLAAPVTDRRGRRLIPAEVELTERHIQALKMWGVPHVEVDGDGPQDTAPLDVSPEEEARARETVGARFGDADREHPFIQALFECAVKRALSGSAPSGGPS